MTSDNVFFWLADVPSNDLYKTLLLYGFVFLVGML